MGSFILNFNNISGKIKLICIYVIYIRLAMLAVIIIIIIIYFTFK